jgi:hypothetical protein
MYCILIVKLRRNIKKKKENKVHRYLVHFGFVLIVMSGENNRGYYANENSVVGIIVCVARAILP